MLASTLASTLAGTFFITAVTLGLAVLGLSPGNGWAVPWVLSVAAASLAISALCVFWHVWSRPRLEVLYDQVLLMLSDHGKHNFRMAIRNRGAMCAENVKVRLIDTTRLNRGRNHFPCSVVCDGVEWDNASPDFIDTSAVSINPHGQQLFTLIHACRDSENNFILDKIDTHLKGSRYPWTISQEKNLN
jgi:hypothetical protein